MLAHFAKPDLSLGVLEDDLHAPDTFRYQLIALIAHYLPGWRDDPHRSPTLAETELTEQLCRYLCRVGQHGDGWDCIQFVHESRDDCEIGRVVDIGIAPSEHRIVIEDKRYDCYDTIMYIECKRLPTPMGSNRDEREYVFSEYGNQRGGIQRFKSGAHCANHTIAMMIGYVQEDTPKEWHPRVCQWIKEIAADGEAGWSIADLLEIEADDQTARVMELRSRHDRDELLPEIELRHLWVQII